VVAEVVQFHAPTPTPSEAIAGTGTFAMPVKRGLGSDQRQLEAGLLAFWRVADRLHMSAATQRAVLDTSESSLLRWRKGHLPSPTPDFLDRLRLLLLSYQRLVELAGSEEGAAQLFWRRGGAESAGRASQSIADVLETRSLLALQRVYHHLDSVAASS
jgi:hypothetical protein